jgi:hypothetical protein
LAHGPVAQLMPLLALGPFLGLFMLRPLLVAPLHRAKG